MNMENDPRKHLCIGIDLGTSNTEITVLDPDETVTTLPITQNHHASGMWKVQHPRLASLVCFAHDGTPMFGDVYRRLTPEHAQYYGRVVLNTKRMLMEQPESKTIHVKKTGGTIDEYSPMDIGRLLLEQCRIAAEAQKNYQPSDKVMITVPCGYQLAQIQATICAAREAGFHIPTDTELITEPVAAVIEYIKRQNRKYSLTDPKYIDTDKPQNILVYDLGGGTLDLSVVRVELRDGTYHFTELANNEADRDRTIGGADFDTIVGKKLADHLLQSAAALRGCTVQDIVERLGQSNYLDTNGLREVVHGRAYEMKTTLFQQKQSELNPISFFDDPLTLNCLPIYVTPDGEPVKTILGGKVTEIESLSYRDMVKTYLTPGTPRNILDPIPDVLSQAILDGRPLPASQVNKILITGGMCQFAPVRDALINYLEQLAQDPDNPIKLTILESDAGLDAVSIGAAYSHTLKIQNHREQQRNRLFLNISEGLPRELLSSIRSRAVLNNARRALLVVYSGSSSSDPDMSKQYYYEAKFNPPLELPAEITFHLHTHKSSEVELTGDIHEANGKLRQIKLEKLASDMVEVLPYPIAKPTAPGKAVSQTPSEPPKMWDPFNIFKEPPTAFGSTSTYTGSSEIIRPARPGSNNRLFLNSSSNHDHSVSETFREILLAMDIDNLLDPSARTASLPIHMRFELVINLLRDYYRSPVTDRNNPLLQYALYAMLQLPLKSIDMPNFPKWHDENSLLRSTELKEIATGVTRFCEEVGSLYLTISDDRKQQFLEELRYCITEWHWESLFQLCTSIAQKIASTELAQLLQERLYRWKQAVANQRPVAMTQPDILTQRRLGQIYWNAMDSGRQLDRNELDNLEKLLQGHYCNMDHNWISSKNFSNHFQMIPAQNRNRMIKNNPALISIIKPNEKTPDDIQSPRDLLDPAFKNLGGAKRAEQRSAYWSKTCEFLKASETAWETVDVLTRRGREYDQSAKEILTNMTPGDARQKLIWIRALGFCRSEAAYKKLNKLWKECYLYSKVRTIQDSSNPNTAYSNYLTAHRRWLNPEEADFIQKVIEDHSLDILTVLCLCAKKDERKRYQILLTTLIAAIPCEWASSQGTFGTLWSTTVNAVRGLWGNLTMNEQTDFRGPLTGALYNLSGIAAKNYPLSAGHFDQALQNFSNLFLAHRSLHKLYHCDLVNNLISLFEKAAEAGTCPLSFACQHTYLRFLEQKYNANDIRSNYSDYKALMKLWYQLSDKTMRQKLLLSPAVNHWMPDVPD